MMIAAPDDLKHVFDAAFSNIRQSFREHTPGLIQREVGTITNVSTGIASVSGLDGVSFEEIPAIGPEPNSTKLHSTFTSIQIDIAIIMRFSVREMNPSGTSLPPPTQAQLRSRFSI